MNVYITGGNKSLRELAHSLINYCADKLFSDNLRNKISIDVDFTRTLYKEDGILGEVDFDDNNHRPKEFTMTVDITGSKRRIMETIAHEMVHIKQYAKGELVDLNSGFLIVSIEFENRLTWLDPSSSWHAAEYKISSSSFSSIAVFSKLKSVKAPELINISKGLFPTFFKGTLFAKS